MQQRVDPNRILELSQKMKTMNRSLENNWTGMQRDLSRLVSDASSSYSEPYVRQAVYEVESLLRELGTLSESTSRKLDRKESDLRWAAEQYRKTEEEAKAKSKQSSSTKFGWAKQVFDWFNRNVDQLRQKAMDAAGQLLKHPPSLMDLVKSLVNQAKDASVENKLDAFKEDQRISSLLDILKTGSEQDQTWAREELRKIANGLDEIAKQQTAYGVYSTYGNQAYMNKARDQAELQRSILAGLGVDPKWYSKDVNLRANYTDSPLSACEYNPLKTDGSAMPTDGELRLVIAAGLVNEKYREWAKVNYNQIEVAVKKAAVEREVQRQIEEYRRLNGPPMELPDGTPINPNNKENETTFAYWQEHIQSKNTNRLTNPYLEYLSWLDETYGKTEWRKKVETVDGVIRGFGTSLIKETVMGVVGTVQFAFNFVVDPAKTTQEVVDTATYLIQNPQVLVEAAKKIYKDFDSGSPEEKAEMLGSVASLFVPGISVTKVGKVSKVAEVARVADKATDPSKVTSKAVDMSKIKELLPSLSNLFPYELATTPEGFRMIVPKESSVHVNRIEGSGGGSKAKVEGTSNGGSGSKSSYPENIDDFLSGNKKFDEVLDDFATVYAEKVNSNAPWKWRNVPGGDTLTQKQIKLIRERAKELEKIPDVPMKPGTKHPDFEKADLIIKIDGKPVILQLPKDYWKISDPKQFQWLDSQLPGGKRPSGTTWHHSEIDGRMELVPFGIHNSINHQGGRAPGGWAHAKR